MKKQYVVKMALATVALGMIGVVDNAGAVSLDDSTSVVSYASELTIPVTFDAAVTAISKVGLGVGASPVVEFSCTAPQDTGNLPTAAYDVAGVNVSLDPQLTGPERYTYLLAGTAVAADKLFTWGDITTPKMTVNSGSSVSCTYKIYEMTGATTPLAATTGSLVAWKTGLNVKADDATCGSPSGCQEAVSIVDMAAAGKKFEGNLTKGLIGKVLLDVDGTVMAADGVTPVSFDGIGGMVNTTTPATKLEITGDFSAAKNVWFDATNNCATAPSTTNKAALNTAKTTATFSNTQIVGGWATGDDYICIEVDGTTAINDSNYTGKAILAGGQNYSLPAAISLGTVGQIKNNGSTDLLNLVLTPGGAYPGYIRINHTTPASGDVSMTLMNDQGQSVTIKLGDVAGQTTSTLAGNAATSQMTLADIYVAAQAADATFAVNGGKLRILAKSTAPAMADSSAVNASSYSTSKDGNSFVLLQE